jgi:hypothetical protein
MQQVFHGFSAISLPMLEFGKEVKNEGNKWAKWSNANRDSRGHSNHSCPPRLPYSGNTKNP